MGARLIIDKGPLSGTELVLEEGESWSLGSAEGKNDIVLEDEKIAPTQIKIVFAKGRYTLVNLDSASPAMLNGKPVTQEEELATGMRLSFGDTQCVFHAQVYDEDEAVYEFSLPPDSKQTSLFSSSGSATAPSSSAASGGSQEAGAVPQGTTPTKAEEGAAFTDKDQELAKSLLSQAKAESGTAGSGGAVKEELPQSAPAQSSGAPVAGEASDAPASTPPSQDLPKPEVSAPQANDDKSTEQVENVKEDTEKQSSEQEASEEEQQTETGKEENPETVEPKAESEEAPAKAEEPVAPEGQENTGEKAEEEAPKAEEEAKEADSEQPEGEEKTPEEQETAQEEKTEGGDAEQEAKEEGDQEEKSGVITPFDVQDLFRFDQDVFPVEMEESIHKHIEADLSQPPRFLLKVLSGANVGAEFHLDSGKSYIIGSDVDVADIVLNDSSVSHQHAKLIVGNDGSVMIEDLGSKNGVIVEGRKIEHNSTLSANQVVALGTTLFLLIDHLAPADTIMATFAPEDYGLFGRPQNEEEFEKQAIEEEEKRRKQATLPAGSFILTLFIGGLAVLFGVGTASLFSVKEVVPVEEINIEEDLNRIIQEFPSVRYTFNKGNGQLFLIGHVKNSIDKSELLYKVDALSFIRSVDDNVINDEAVWQEMNILLSKRPEFQGVTMYSPEPGRFVLSGYVKTEKQASCLSEYLNLHFNYLSLLENKVVVETFLFQTVTGQLIQAGFANIQVSFANGEIILTGYVNHESEAKFRAVVDSLADISGVRMIKNFVVVLPVEEGVIDLNLRYPRRYRITGYSKYGDASINVVINGRILTRGDVLDGMTITSIQPNCIFLEKGGLRYKIEYNQ